MTDIMEAMNEKLMKISEIAASLGISVKAMRIYEHLGIIKPAEINKQTGYRYYSIDQVDQLSTLIELQKLGFSLAEIKKLLAYGVSNDDYMEALVHKKANWQNTISYIENKVEDIEVTLEKLKCSKTDNTGQVFTELRCSKLPDWIVRLYADSIQSELLWL